MSGFDYGQGLPDYGDGVHEHVWEVTSSFSRRRSVAGLEALREMLSPGGYFASVDGQNLYDHAHASQGYHAFLPMEGWLAQVLEETVLGPGLWALMGLDEHEAEINDMEMEVESRHDIQFDYDLAEDFE